MKQTAVDFLMGKLFDPSTMVAEQIQWFEQAKEMEKQQIKEAYKDGSRDLEIQYSDVGEINSEQYYNETYE
jgi:hypothetical protein